MEEIRRKIPIVTTLLVGINVIIWLFLELKGDTQAAFFMLKYGAAYPPFIVENGEWWRLFTCMFLHFGADHLINNMLMLYVTGIRLEHALGSIRYGILYLLSGLCGSILSCYMELAETEMAVSAGASGAVFGVVGGLIALAIWNRGRIEGLTAKGLLGMLALSLYYGFAASGVDNWGHIGGLVGGFVLGCMFALMDKMRIRWQKSWGND